MFEVEIKNRWTGDVKFTAELIIDTGSTALNMGLAIQWGYDNKKSLKGAYCVGADCVGADFEDADFEDADFEGANFKGADCVGANFKGANFKGAYCEGAYFKGANFKGANFKDAYCEGANCEGANCEGANFEDADFEDAYCEGANFKGANFKGANFKDAYCEGAYFKGANCEGADFEDADFEGVPIIENIHQKVYAAAKVEGALNMNDWHTCKTTHCRAGWVVHLAGEEGKKLEDATGSTASAAYRIYRASDPDTAFALNFHTDNETALFDMKKLADQEADK